MSISLPPPIAALLAELATDHAFGPAAVAPLYHAFAALDREADDNWHASQLMQALALIATQPRPARARFEDIARIIGMSKGPTTITIARPAS
jgi:hypothetical protein